MDRPKHYNCRCNLDKIKKYSFICVQEFTAHAKHRPPRRHGLYADLLVLERPEHNLIWALSRQEHQVCDDVCFKQN